MRRSPEAMKVWREAQSFFDEHPEGPFADTDAAHEVAASVIEAALQKARDEERDAVVAWLRNDASAAWGEACDDMEEMSWCIEAIERGEHRREG